MGAVLRDNGYSVNILDSTCEGYYNTMKYSGDYISYGLNDEEIIERINDFKPDLVGITSMFSEQQVMTDHYCSMVKDYDKNLKIVTGGNPPTFSPEEAIKSKADFVVMGEGEERLLSLLDSLNKNKTPDFDGLSFKENGKIKINKPCALIENLDDIPLPARDLIDMEKYIDVGIPFSPFSLKSRVEQIMTTRGCPFRCSFCSSTSFWGYRLRKRSVGNVMKEIDVLVNEYKIQEIQFSDDNLTVDKKRAIELFKILIPYNLSWCMPNGTMVGTLDNSLIDLMASSGAYQLSFALESGSQRLLKEVIHKRVPEKKKLKSLISRCHENNIQVHGMFIVGFPGETKEDIQKTFDYPYEIDLDSASFFVASPLPGSDLYEECKTKNYILDGLADFKSSIINIPRDSKDYLMDKKEYEYLVDKETKKFNEYIKRTKKEQWETKYSQFLKRHKDKSNLISGRVT